jgi:protease I
VVRTDDDALKLIQTHYAARRPIAAICAGTIVLVNAGLSRGLLMTGSPPVSKDLQNSGARYVDNAAVFDRGILTSRSPDDLAHFVTGLRYLRIGT